jgi:hypothetical protein
MKMKKKLPDSLKDSDIQGMFNKLSGISSADLEIIYPKYEKINTNIDNITKVLCILSEQLTNPKEFENFVNSRVVIDIKVDLQNKTQDMQDKFHEAFKEFKKSKQVLDIIQLCDNIAPYKSDILKQDLGFIINSPKTSFCIFPFSELDLKNFLIIDSMKFRKIGAIPQSPLYKLIANILEKLFTFSYEIYKLISSPDINIDELTDVLELSMGDLRKRPELSQCGDAFNEIKKSMHLLKDNFGEYYKDFLQTGNSTIIMENFVLDVSKKLTNEKKAGPKLGLQFRKIVKYYKNISEKMGGPQDPKIKKLFSVLSSNIDVLDSKSQNIKREESKEEEPEEEQPEPEKQQSKDERKFKEKIKDMTIEQIAEEIDKVNDSKKSKKKK